MSNKDRRFEPPGRDRDPRAPTPAICDCDGRLRLELTELTSSRNSSCPRPELLGAARPDSSRVRVTATALEADTLRSHFATLISMERPDPDEALARLRALCLALPEVTEKLSH